MADFIIKTGAGVWWPVIVMQGIDGGVVAEAGRFDIKFRRVARSEIEAIRALDDAAFVARVATAWRGVIDGDGMALPFTPTGIAQALDVMGVAEAIGTAWGKFVAGIAETRLGNSEASPAGGPAAAATAEAQSTTA